MGSKQPQPMPEGQHEAVVSPPPPKRDSKTDAFAGCHHMIYVAQRTANENDYWNEVARCLGPYLRDRLK